MNSFNFNTWNLKLAYKEGVINELAYTWAMKNLEYLNKPMRLLSTRSAKLIKGEKKGYTTAVLYLQPANKVSRKTLCPGAKMAGCLDGCLIKSGQLGMTYGQNAATKRTLLFLLRREAFETQLQTEVDKLYVKHHDRLAVRLNGTTDIDWSHIIRRNPCVQFYDYTKVYSRVEKNKLHNYALTYSASAYSTASKRATIRAIEAGHNVVFAFNTKELRGEFQRPDDLADFDETDLRFLDEPGTLGGLIRKGSNKAEREEDNDKPSFFFNEKSYNNLIAAVNIT